MACAASPLFALALHEYRLQKAKGGSHFLLLRLPPPARPPPRDGREGRAGEARVKQNQLEKRKGDGAQQAEGIKLRKMILLLV